MLDEYLIKTGTYPSHYKDGIEISGYYHTYELDKGNELTVSLMTRIPYSFLQHDSLGIFRRDFSKNISQSGAVVYYFVNVDYENNKLIVYDDNGHERNSSVFISLHINSKPVANYFNEMFGLVSDVNLFKQKYFDIPSFF